MRKTLLLLILLLSGLGIMAQTPTPSQPSAEDIKQAKETVRALVGSATPTPHPVEQGKTMADVLDKGLDTVTGYVSALEGVVSKYAPEVWRIMITQQYAKAVAYPLFWGLMLLGILIYRNTVKGWFGVQKGTPFFERLDNDNDDSYWSRVWFAGIIPAVLAIPIGIVFLYNLTESIMVFINPEYYALKDIIQLLR